MVFADRVVDLLHRMNDDLSEDPLIVTTMENSHFYRTHFPRATVCCRQIGETVKPIFGMAGQEYHGRP